MYPPVRQLTTPRPDPGPDPRPRTQRREHAAGRRPRRPSAGPARYRLALLACAGAYAVITAILAALAPTPAPWPLALRTLVLSLPMVGALTWLVMPALTRRWRARHA